MLIVVQLLGYTLPPGPPRKPIIGNILDMPMHHEWETITKWAEQYGDIVYTESFGQPMVFLNSLDAARELFDNRSAVYSDRPEAPSLNMSGWNHYIVSMRYDPTWKIHRRVFHQHFNQKAVDALAYVQIKHARNMIRNMYQEPEEYIDHLRHVAASIIIEMVYGMQLKPKGDRFIELAHAALAGISVAVLPWAFYVDMIPWLRHLPSWLPGMEWKRKVQEWRIPTLEMAELPFKIVKDGLASGTAPPSILATALNKLASQDSEKARPDDEQILRDTHALAYVAGAGTSVAIMISFMLALVLHPDAQRKAQEELDRVLGDRLPDMEDRDSLPYTNALIEEVQRWRPAVPLGIPHALIEDDTYGEYFFKKGTIFFQNTW
ncbi:hypothetical protein M422DRAFT_154433 [Sphaerobolus stellatus SS14]|nr:hypothetical protein M422DRAFT_154433 [Sphaerobolus stellatus SS14]